MGSHGVADALCLEEADPARERLSLVAPQRRASDEAAELLPEPYASDAGRWRKGTDTMDVWFDSGASWSAVLLPDRHLG